tara:strand:+ start:383 stop:634 length:252 start_codon:yes stop_codon:yes gene_type:complete
MMVIYASWLIDLNSENNNGKSETIITIVVLITAWYVFCLQKLIDSSIDRFLFLQLLYAEMIWIESSTIKPKTIAKIKAFDKLK